MLLLQNLLYQFEQCFYFQLVILLKLYRIPKHSGWSMYFFFFFLLQRLITYLIITQQFMFCSSVCGLFICLSKTRVSKSVSYSRQHNACLSMALRFIRNKACNKCRKLLIFRTSHQTSCKDFNPTGKVQQQLHWGRLGKTLDWKLIKDKILSERSPFLPGFSDLIIISLSTTDQPRP